MSTKEEKCERTVFFIKSSNSAILVGLTKVTDFGLNRLKPNYDNILKWLEQNIPNKPNKRKKHYKLVKATSTKYIVSLSVVRITAFFNGISVRFAKIYCTSLQLPCISLPFKDSRFTMASLVRFQHRDFRSLPLRSAGLPRESRLSFLTAIDQLSSRSPFHSILSLYRPTY